MAKKPRYANKVPVFRGSAKQTRLKPSPSRSSDIGFFKRENRRV